MDKWGRGLGYYVTSRPQNDSRRSGAGDQGTMLLADPRSILGDAGHGIRVLGDYVISGPQNDSRRSGVGDQCTMLLVGHGISALCY